jgi:hypothetical protein
MNTVRITVILTLGQRSMVSCDKWRKEFLNPFVTMNSLWTRVSKWWHSEFCNCFVVTVGSSWSRISTCRTPRHAVSTPLALWRKFCDEIHHKLISAEWPDAFRVGMHCEFKLYNNMTPAGRPLGATVPTALLQLIWGFFSWTTQKATFGF